MNRRYVVLLGVLVALVAAASVSSAGQAPGTAGKTAAAAKQWTQPRTAWGDPDLQGIWQGVGGAPLERPQRFAGREFLTDAEVAAKEQDARARDAQRLAGTAEEFGFRLQPNYNGVFQGTPTTSPNFRISRRTASIIDPPDGRLPPLTPEALKRWEARDAASRGRGESDTPLDRALPERCINVETAGRVGSWGLGGQVADTSVSAAAARTDIGLVGNGEGGGGGGGWRQILQGPGYVVMLMQSDGGGGGQEKFRIIPLDRRPALGPKVRQYMGEARGHWDGNTLVVEITNLAFADPIFTTYGQAAYPGSSETLRIVERYTLLGADSLEYRYTIDDPETYTRPYTVFREFARDDGFALAPELCHEVNRDMGAILASARADEVAAVEFAAESAQKRRQRLEEVKAESAAVSNKNR